MIESREPYVFDYISLRSYMKSIFVNIYSNVERAQFCFPFLMLYNEYSGTLYYQRIQSLVESNALYMNSNASKSRSRLRIKEIPSIPSKLPHPTTRDRCCFVKQIHSAQFNIIPSRQTETVIVQHAKELGLVIQEDCAK